MALESPSFGRTTVRRTVSASVKERMLVLANEKAEKAREDKVNEMRKVARRRSMRFEENRRKENKQREEKSRKELDKLARRQARAEQHRRGTSLKQARKMNEEARKDVLPRRKREEESRAQRSRARRVVVDPGQSSPCKAPVRELELDSLSQALKRASLARRDGERPAEGSCSTIEFPFPSSPSSSFSFWTARYENFSE
ncbi:hypothetical protein HOP50_08g51120 [Chloropicon primus]|nr:hypothetical protein HOP50_08g51120 [Chloropicon primus]